MPNNLCFVLDGLVSSLYVLLSNVDFLVGQIYKCEIKLANRKLKLELIALSLNDFGIIVGTKFLKKYHTYIDYSKKSVNYVYMEKHFNF